MTLNTERAMASFQGGLSQSETWTLLIEMHCKSEKEAAVWSLSLVKVVEVIGGGDEGNRLWFWCLL